MTLWILIVCPLAAFKISLEQPFPSGLPIPFNEPCSWSFCKNLVKLVFIFFQMFPLIRRSRHDDRRLDSTSRAKIFRNFNDIIFSAKCQDTASTSWLLLCVTKAVEIEPLNVWNVLAQAFRTVNHSKIFISDFVLQPIWEPIRTSKTIIAIRLKLVPRIYGRVSVWCR